MSRSFPQSNWPPALATVAEDILDGGHLWLHEYPDGTPLWVRLTATGTLEFAVPVRDGGFAGVASVPPGDESRRVERFDATDAPPELGFAVRHARRVFDRDALRAATESPETVEFLCVAVHRRQIEYDWDATPPLVGLDVSHPESSLLPHEIQETFEAVGVDPAPVVQKEAHSRDIDPAGIALPDSAWRDGDALGVLYRAKDGRTARQIDADDAGETAAEPISDDAGEFTASVVTTARIDDAVAALDAAGRSTDVDAVAEWLFDRLVRESFPSLTHGSTVFDLGAFRSSLSAVVAERRGRGCDF